MIGKYNTPIPVRIPKYNVYPSTQVISSYSKDMRGVGDYTFPAYVPGVSKGGTFTDANGQLIDVDVNGQIIPYGADIVSCVNGTCTDRMSGETFIDPTPVAIGVGAAVGMLVNPILGLAAGFLYYQAAKKPGSVHSQG